MMTNNNAPFISIKRFDGSAAQKLRLEEISLDWQAGQGFWTTESILESLEGRGTFLWAAADKQSSRWLGVALIKVAEDDAELLYIHTATTCRRLGIGNQMLETVLNDLKSGGLVGFHPQKMFLEVRASNHSAQELYKRAGFRESGLRRKYYKDGEDALVFEINLT